MVRGDRPALAGVDRQCARRERKTLPNRLRGGPARTLWDQHRHSLRGPERGPTALGGAQIVRRGTGTNSVTHTRTHTRSCGALFKALEEAARVIIHPSEVRSAGAAIPVSVRSTLATRQGRQYCTVLHTNRHKHNLGEPCSRLERKHERQKLSVS